MNTDLAATRKRLRELLAQLDVVNNKLGWNEENIDTIHEVERECVDAMPALLDRIDALEAAVRYATWDPCQFCRMRDRSHEPGCIVLTLPPEEPKP